MRHKVVECLHRNIFVGVAVCLLLWGCGQASSGGGEAQPSPNTTPVSGQKVFVTSQTFNGDFRGVTGEATGLLSADKVCQDAARGAELEGLWIAWLSDTNVDAIDRIEGEGPFVLVDGKTVVFDQKESLKGSPAAPINQTEEGETVSMGLVWTGTLLGGLKGTNHCENWTDNTLNLAVHPTQGRVGSLELAGEEWTDLNEVNCLNKMRLYCFEVLDSSSELGT